MADELNDLKECMGDKKKKLANWLKQNPFFAEFSEDMLSYILPIVKILKIPERTLVLKEGQINTKLYIMNRGQLRVFYNGENVATITQAGNLVGEMSVIQSQPVTATIVTDIPTELISIEVNDFFQFSDNKSQKFQEVLYRIFSVILTRKLLTTNEKARKFEIAARELEQAKIALERMNQQLESRVEQRTTELRLAHQQTATVLENLGQGFLIINRKGVIEPGFSKMAKDIFGDELSGRQFFNILGLESEEEQQKVKDWLELCFAGSMAFNSLKKLGPHSYTSPRGDYVELEYRPVEDQNQQVINKIICIASIKTEEKRLRQEAETERNLAQMVMSILKDRSAFVDFVLTVRWLFKELKENFQIAPFKKWGQGLRSLHTLKGALASYYFSDLAAHVHVLEDKVKRIRQTNSGIANLSELVQDLEEINQGFEGFLRDHESLLGKVSGAESKTKTISWTKVQRTLEAVRNDLGADSALYQHLRDAFLLENLATAFGKYESTVQRLARQQQKRVEFKIHRSSEKVYLPAYQHVIDSCVHIIRNAIDHGIELPEERLDQGKSEVAQIEVMVKKDPQELQLVVVMRDDGRGVSPYFLRQKLAAKGLHSAAQLEKMSDNDVLQLVFEQGVSTRDQVTELSGRGVGLDAVRATVKALGGKVELCSQVNKGSEIRLYLPQIKDPLSSSNPESFEGQEEVSAA